MTKAIYVITREIAVIAAIAVSVMVADHGYYMRAFLNLILSFLFLFFSKRYEGKYQSITVSYLFVFFVIFITNTIFACYFTPITMHEYNMIGVYGKWIGDYYYIYFTGALLVYLFLNTYMGVIKPPVKQVKPDGTGKFDGVEDNVSLFETISILFGCSIMFLIYFFSANYEFLIPAYTCLFYLLFWSRYKFLAGIIISVSLVIAGGIFFDRYKFIQIIFPLMVIFCMNNRWKDRKFSLITVNVLATVGILLILACGVITEIIKLNRGWGGNYTINGLLNNPAQLEYFCMRQFYRLSFIWIKLGNYIIEHVDYNGFFYGLTYVKFFAPVFGFSYISLPVLSAKYDNAVYAQPGLLAEGYANFGVAGIFFNIILVFLLMELFVRYYYKKPSFFTLVLATVPFTKIILDGGTLNSAIFLLVICFMLFLINFLNERSSHQP